MAARSRLPGALLALAALLSPRLLFVAHRRAPQRPSPLQRRAEAEVAEEVYVDDPLAAEDGDDGDRGAQSDVEDGDQSEDAEKEEPWMRFRGQRSTKPKLKLYRNFNMRGTDMRTATADLAAMLSSHVGMVFQLIGDQEEPGDALTILGRFRGRLEVEATVGGRHMDNRPRFNVVAFMDPFKDAPALEPPENKKELFFAGANMSDRGLAVALERDLANQVANGTGSVAERFIKYRGYQAARQAARALELLRFNTGWDVRIRAADLGGEETLVQVRVGRARRLYPRVKDADTAVMLLSVHVVNVVEFQGSNSEALDLLASMPRTFHAALLFGPGPGNFFLTRGYPLRTFRLKQEGKKKLRNLVVEESSDPEELVDKLHNILNRKRKHDLGIVTETPAAGVLALDALRKLQSLSRREFLVVDAAPEDEAQFLVCIPL